MNFKLSKSKILIAGLCATLAVVAFASTALAYTEDDWQTSPYADLRIDGSTTEWPTISAALNISTAGGTSTTSPFQAYANPSGTVLCQAYEGGSGQGQTAVISDSTAGQPGNVDANVGMSSSTSNPNALEDPVCRDGICMIVNNTSGAFNNFAGLSLAQIAQIYDGLVTNWNQVGGPNVPMYPIARIIGSGTRSSLESFTGITDSEEQAAYAAGGVWAAIPRIDATADVVTAIDNGQTGYLGYVGIGFANSVASNVLVIPVSANVANPVYVPATAQTVTANTYPMSRFLWLIIGNPSTNPGYGTSANYGTYGKQLVNFMQSPAGQAIAANQGEVVLNPPQDVNGDGVVNISDVVIIGLHWNTHTAQSNYLAAADVNGDGVINISDVVSVGLWWNVHVYPTPTNQW
jgi:ABC-type phosphate transport system substrate-binding protein